MGAGRQDPYQALVEQIPAVLYVNGPGIDAHTLYVSPQTNSILGLTEEQWFDDTWTHCLHPEDAETVAANYARFIAEESVGVDEYRFIRPDGEQMWIHDRVTIIRDESGEPTLVQGVMFDITAAKRAETELGAQAAQLARVEQIGRAFSQALLEGSDLSGLLRHLADIVGNPVAFEDSAHQLIAYADGPPGAARVLSGWDAHSRAAHDLQARACVCAPVRVRDEEWGTVHLIRGARDIDDVDEVALDRACAAIGLWLLSRGRGASLAEAARAELLAEIWRGGGGGGGAGDDLLDRARSLGTDLRECALVVLAVDLAPVRRGEGEWANSALRRRAAEGVVASLRTALAGSGLPGITGCVGEACLAVVGMPGDLADRAARDRLARSVTAELRGRHPGLPASVGVCGPVGVAGLRRGITQAHESAVHGSGTLSSGAAVTHAEDVGLRLLLGTLGEGPELSRFVEAELGPLLDHETSGRLPLLETVRAHLATGGCKADTARALHLERRSLYYRLERIEDLLGRSLDDPSTRLRLDVALQGLDVLNARGTDR